MFRTVRARTALGATLVVAVALVAAGIAVLSVLRANLVDQADLQARVGARDVATQLATGTPYGDLDFPDGPVRVVGERGKVLADSDELESVEGVGAPRGGGPGGEDDEDDEDDASRGEVSEDDEIRSGSATVDGETQDYRFAVVEGTTRPGVEFTVYGGAPLTAEQEAVSSVREAMLVGLPCLLAFVAGVTWLFTRRALRPVEGVRAEMAAITASADLSRRVPVPQARDEIGRLARTTNETLAALESSVERQRRFVADVSHELRSPIASLRTQLEVGEAHPELLDVPGAVEDTVRLQALAADLLLLARLDAGERPAEGRVELAGFVREEVSQRRDALPVGVEAEEVEVGGSRAQLARVLGNLLDNAQRHAEGRVSVSVRRDGGWAVLTVADDGDGVPEGERERIFERFVRLDDARSRDDGGAGLGLAIARDVVERHGGTLGVRDAAGGGALFEVRLPAVAPATGAGAAVSR